MDLLLNEREAAKSVNKIQCDIEFKREYYEYIRNMFPDCEAKDADLDRVVEEIAKLQDDKVEAEQALRTVRRGLALYIKALIY